jgi:hypothetical protein
VKQNKTHILLIMNILYTILLFHIVSKCFILFHSETVFHSETAVKQLKYTISELMSCFTVSVKQSETDETATGIFYI